MPIVHAFGLYPNAKAAREIVEGRPTPGSGN